MKHDILFTFTFAASLCAMPVLFAGPDDSPFGGSFMDDLIKPFDDTAVELPGESSHKPSVSRSAQLVDDSATDTWGARSDDSGSSAKPSSCHIVTSLLYSEYCCMSNYLLKGRNRETDLM